MSDPTSTAASEPVNPYLAPNPYAAQNPYVAPNPYAAQNPPASAPGVPVPPPYQPVPTSLPLTPYSPGGAAYAYAPRTNPLAIVSLVLSLVGLVTGITAIGGVITGHIALSQIKRTGEGGRGMAIGGLVVGYVVTGFFLLYVLLMIVLFAGFGLWGTGY